MRPNLLCNLKGDLLGGTRADTVSLFGGESEFDLGCCCLKTSALDPVIDIKSETPPTQTNTCQTCHASFSMSWPRACPLTVPDTDNLLMALCHFLVRNFILKKQKVSGQFYLYRRQSLVRNLYIAFAPYLETAITTRTAALNRLRGLCWEERGGDGRAPIWAMRHSVACSHSWKPPNSSSK